MHFSSLLRRTAALEVMLDLMLLFQGYEVDLNGALYNEQHGREINISLSGQGWSQLQYFKSERNVLSTWIYSGFNTNKIKVHTRLFLTLPTVLAPLYNYPGYLLNVS